jgi:hypothetical protein
VAQSSARKTFNTHSTWGKGRIGVSPVLLPGGRNT